MSDTSAPPATSGSGWLILRAGTQASDGLEIPTIPTDVMTPNGPVRLALGPNREARVLLPLRDDERPSGMDGGSALGVVITAPTLKGRKVRFLDLSCLSASVETVFAEVVDEILVRVRKGAVCSEAARTTIADFRSLLVRSRQDEVEISTVAGLVAELLVLNRLLDRSPRAWRAWRGPLGDRHDFRVGDTSLEVKATIRAATSTITINGLEQLAAPAGGNLHLLRLVLEPVSNGALSVAALGRRATQKADEPGSVAQLLAALDCEDVEAQRWNRHSFRQEGETLYEVSDGFPCLVPALLLAGAAPTGVSEISYRIDVARAAPFARGREIYRSLEEELSLCP